VLLKLIKDKVGHDMMYAIYNTKIENELCWKADYSFESWIVKSIEWYLNRYKTNV